MLKSTEFGADVAVEFSLNGTDWTIASGASGELAGLSTGQYEASWDTLFDLPDTNGETVELRLTPTDGTPTLAGLPARQRAARRAAGG